jgi:hypothetical protein
MQIFSDKSNLYIKLSTVEKILSVHGSFIIPLGEISETHTRTPPCSLKQLRIPGTFIPGLIKAGTYFSKRGWEFWYVTRKKKFFTIELKKGFYKRLILSVDENENLGNSV